MRGEGEGVGEGEGEGEGELCTISCVRAASLTKPSAYLLTYSLAYLL